MHLAAYYLDPEIVQCGLVIGNKLREKNQSKMALLACIHKVLPGSFINIFLVC